MNAQREVAFPGLAGSGELVGQTVMDPPGLDTSRLSRPNPLIHPT